MLFLLGDVPYVHPNCHMPCPACDAYVRIVFYLSVFIRTAHNISDVGNGIFP